MSGLYTLCKQDWSKYLLITFPDSEIWAEWSERLLFLVVSGMLHIVYKYILKPTDSGKY